MFTENVLGDLENSFKAAAVIGLRSWAGSGGVFGGGGTAIFGTASLSLTSCAGLGMSGLTSIFCCASIDFVNGLVGALASFSMVGPVPVSSSHNFCLIFGPCSSLPFRNVDLGALYSFAGD